MPPTEINTPQDAGVLSNLSDRTEFPLTSGIATPSVDKGNQTTTALQITRKDAELHGAELSDRPIHENSGVLISESLSTNTADKTIDSADPESSNRLDESEHGDDDNEITSFPPRLQSVSRTPLDQPLISQVPTILSSEKISSEKLSAGKEASDDNNGPTSSKKTPALGDRRSRTSDSANRPKLVRVK
jgi:hypothetical protein